MAKTTRTEVDLLGEMEIPDDLYYGIHTQRAVNMNANEIIANVGLQLNGHPKGSYDILNPNDHVNKSQSTNDAYPTGKTIQELVLEKKLLSKEELDQILSIENLMHPEYKTKLHK